ncbi:MAG: hypothetical protein F7C38_00665 [Desulfurococcales archaeon]|nr:hypothetical protein [Desulfurococcales archaeon]
MSRNFIANIVYLLLLAASLFGAYIASQIDAPYGVWAGLESMLYSLGGGLVLYSLVPLLVGGKRMIRSSLLFAVVGLAIVALDYRLYVTIYQGYYTTPTPFYRYIVMAPFTFILMALFGVLWVWTVLTS